MEKKTIKVNTPKATPKKTVQKKSTTQTSKVIYTCPMHPEVQRSKPGSCPKCGMDLEKKTIKVNAPKTAPKKTVDKPVPTKTQPVQTDDHNHADHQVKEQPKTQQP
ncbi:MAG: heavy metal-binding domain-containing protein, partial [Chitinophagaceae bacterium]